MDTTTLKMFWLELESQWKIAFVQGIFKREIDWSLQEFSKESSSLENYVPTNEELLLLTEIRTLKLSGKGGGDINFNLTNLSGLIQLSTINNKLEELRLDYNNIRSIEGLAAFRNLRILQLSDNMLSDLNGCEGLEQLEELYVSNNFLKNLEGIEHLTNLQMLGLTDNRKLENLHGIEKLHKLSNLYVSGLSNLLEGEIPKIKMALPNCYI